MNTSKAAHIAHNNPAIAKPLKIELRNVQHVAAMSEETQCFTATVYVNGEKAGTASNHGHGGSTDINPRALEERLNAYAKTLPLKPWGDFGSPDGSKGYEQSGETLVDDALFAFLEDRDMRRSFARDLKNKVLFIRDGECLFFKMPKGVTPAEALKNPKLRAKVSGLQVLNEMDPEEALKVYRASVQQVSK